MASHDRSLERNIRSCSGNDIEISTKHPDSFRDGTQLRRRYTMEQRRGEERQEVLLRVFSSHTSSLMSKGSHTLLVDVLSGGACMAN